LQAATAGTVFVSGRRFACRKWLDRFILRPEYLTNGDVSYFLSACAMPDGWPPVSAYRSAEMVIRNGHATSLSFLRTIGGTGGQPSGMAQAEEM